MSMTERDKASRLGRGLAALIGDTAPAFDADGDPTPAAPQPAERGASARRVPVSFLLANPNNPRQAFDEAYLAELAASIAERGIVQPIAVRPASGRSDRFEIIAGERRWRAAQKAGLHEVPIIVHDVSDREALEIAIVENVQRTDLNPVEEAFGYARLVDEFGHTQSDLAASLGKSRSHVANTLRLLKLPDMVLDALRDGRLTAGHARALIGRDDAEALARKIVDNGLTVRQAEALAQLETKSAVPRPPSQAERKDADTAALERRLSDTLGLKIDIRDRGGKGGEIRIAYATVDQLDDVCRRLESPDG